MHRFSFSIRTSQEQNRIRGTVGRSGRAGFTVIEALVAVTILLIALTAVYSAVTSGLRSTTQAKNHVTAFYLAQEAFELIKNKRDTNVLSGDAWDAGFHDNCGSSGCFVKSFQQGGSYRSNSDLEFVDCYGQCMPVAKHTGKDVYGHHYSGSSWERTNFTRTITTEKLNDHEIKVVVRVRWTGPGGDIQEIKVREHLFDWRSS